MHLARVRRHGYPELKKDAYQTLERLPHKIVDDFIVTRNIADFLKIGSNISIRRPEEL